MIMNIDSYWGKQLETMYPVLLMALKLKTPSPYSDCLTLRTFSFKLNVEDSKYWLTPSLSPFQGLLKAIDILGIVKSCKVVHYNNNIDSFLKAIDYNLKNGPVMIGPLDKTCIWKRIDSVYFKGYAYFILITDKKNNSYIVHDPEGCPGYILHIDILKVSLQNINEPKGMLLIKPNVKITPDDSKLYKKILYHGVEVRLNSSNSDCSAGKGLLLLSKILQDRKIKSSEEASLNYSLPFLNLSYRKVYEFLRYIIDKNIFCYSDSINQEIQKVMDILNEYFAVCSYALYYLLNNDIKKFITHLTIMSKKENQLDEIFYLIKNIFEQDGIYE